MAYAGLGSRSVAAAPDTTGNNPGKLSSVFDPSVLSIQVPWFECYHAVVSGIAVPPASATIYIGTRLWDANTFGAVGSWDPAQPMLIQPGDSVYFYWSLAEGAAAPVTTMWFRYDASAWGSSGS